MSLGACSVAVPVRGAGDEVVAALGIVVPDLRRDAATAGVRAAGRRPRDRAEPATVTFAQRKPPLAAPVLRRPLC